MSYEIVIPSGIKETLRVHLLGDRTKEQMAIVLCGVARSKQHLRLLGRHIITMPSSEAFSHQSIVGLELDQSVHRHVLKVAAREGLSQVDFHTHPGDEASVEFSGIDDKNERALARYLAEKLPGTVYASVVLNGKASAARVWEIKDGQPIPNAILPPLLSAGCFVDRQLPTLVAPAARYDRQLRAFGLEFQRRIAALKIGIVGVGGLGSVMVEELTRLGVTNWIVVDPDIIEETNLNRVLGAEERDVEEEKPKIDIARRTIRRIAPKAMVRAFRSSVFTKRTLNALKECDLIIAATDNHASRLTLNALSCQFAIPLVHAGVNLEPDKNGGFTDISGEVVIPSHGEWCLLCSGALDAQTAAREMAPIEEQSLLRHRGYITDTPAPAVCHLNALVASLAVTEIHNLVWAYKPVRRYIVYRELDGEIMAIQVAKNDNCPHCSSDGLLGLGDLMPIKTNRRQTVSLPIPLV